MFYMIYTHSYYPQRASGLRTHYLAARWSVSPCMLRSTFCVCVFVCVCVCFRVYAFMNQAEIVRRALWKPAATQASPSVVDAMINGSIVAAQSVGQFGYVRRLRAYECLCACVCL